MLRVYILILMTLLAGNARAHGTFTGLFEGLGIILLITYLIGLFFCFLIFLGPPYLSNKTFERIRGVSIALQVPWLLICVTMIKMIIIEVFTEREMDIWSSPILYLFLGSPLISYLAVVHFYKNREQKLKNVLTIKSK